VRIVDLYVLGVDVEVIGDEETEARGVQIGARPNDPVGGETGKLPGDVGEDVDRVGNDEESGGGGVTNKRGYDGAEEGKVPLEQVEAGLTGDLAGAGGDDAEIGAGSDGRVSGGVDLGAGEEGGGVLEVEHLAAELVGVGIDEDELVGEVLGEDGLSDGHSDVTNSDDGDLVVLLGGRGRVSVGDGLEEGLG